MGFNNPLTGLNGSLIYPQIKSPNFDLATETGWAILKTGDAYFFNVVATGTITASEFIGTDFIIDSSGIFFYSGTPASGNLLMAIANVAGTDAYGNSYAQGMTFEMGISQLVLGETGGSPLIYGVTGNGNITNSGGLQATSQGAGTSEYDVWQLLGPLDSTQKDFVAIQELSSNALGTQQAEILMFYIDPSTTPHEYLSVGYGGVDVVAGSITAVEPGTGTARNNVAVAEEWHSPTILTGWTVTGAGNPVRYRLLPDGNVQLSGEVLTTAANASGTNIFTMGTGYIPAFQCSFVTESSIAVGAGMATVTVLNASGNVKCQQAFTAAGQILRFDGIIYPTT